MPSRGFDSTVPETPRQGADITVVGYTENENSGVVVKLVPCSECSAAVEEVQLPAHESWHAGQAGSGPKSR